MNILVFGAGQIGKCVAFLLSVLGGYRVFLADKEFDKSCELLKKVDFIKLDAFDQASIVNFIENNEIAVVCSCLPYFCNLKIAKAVVKTNSGYFDLTEDFKDSNKIREIFQNSVAFTQCGLAPGYVDMLVNNTVRNFVNIDHIEVRTGALSSEVDNVLKHSCAWSVDGLINEYLKDAECLLDSKRVVVPGLSRLSKDTILGQEYEMFATSGGVGGLLNLLAGKAKNIEYKTIRHPGHCEKMLMLLDDFKLRNNLKLLREVMCHLMLPLKSDKVVVDIKALGYFSNNEEDTKRVTKIFLPKTIAGHRWLAIQWTTAASVCAMIDLFLEDALSNIYCQDQLDLDVFLQNRFGSLFLN